ncbi:MAG: arginine--tRNA ligase, partial [Deltaproteobacteria bacterium]|nr:arginine--tRNA ligase [Deltaproteobacteria bacterium]
PTDAKFGADLCTNLALVLASAAKTNPRQLAQQIIANLKVEEGLLDRAELAGPGFINFYLHKGWWYKTLDRIEAQQDRYGSLDLGRGQKVQVEFVSANPTGPLHIGHGRGAAVGDVLARILAKAGYEVQREYYINDAGLQISNLGRSTWARYQQLHGQDYPLPENGYKGEYIWDIAREIQNAL